MNKKEKLYERALATCVVMLIICVVLKLFGVQWFNLDTGIPLLNAIDRVVMESNLLSFVYSFVLLFINGYLMCLIVTKDGSLKRYVLPLSLLIIFTYLIKMVIKIDALSIVSDILGLYFVEKTVCSNKPIIKDHILMILLASIYQLLSLYVRDINGIIYYDVVSGSILMLDYYIALVITYLYIKKGDSSLWELFHHSYSSLASQLWKKHSQNSKQCFDKEI